MDGANPNHVIVMQLSVPLLLSLGSLLYSWRLANFPVTGTEDTSIWCFSLWGEMSEPVFNSFGGECFIVERGTSFKYLLYTYWHFQSLVIQWNMVINLELRWDVWLTLYKKRSTPECVWGCLFQSYVLETSLVNCVLLLSGLEVQYLCVRCLIGHWVLAVLNLAEIAQSFIWFFVPYHNIHIF